MNILNPDAGDLLDRLTILSRKVLETEPEGKHFEAEEADIVQRLEARLFSPALVSVVTRLAAVNAAIWELENLLREWRAEYGDDLAGNPGAALRLAENYLTTQALNDERARIIGNLNSHIGRGSDKEKLF